MKARRFPPVEAILLLSLLVMAACGGGSSGETDRAASGTKGEAPVKSDVPPPDRSPVDELPWEKIPLYPGATMEATAPCPPQWNGCGACERRRYSAGDGAEAVCAFYQKEMFWLALMPRMFRNK